MGDDGVRLWFARGCLLMGLLLAALWHPTLSAQTAAEAPKPRYYWYGPYGVGGGPVTRPEDGALGATSQYAAKPWYVWIRGQAVTVYCPAVIPPFTAPDFVAQTVQNHLSLSTVPKGTTASWGACTGYEGPPGWQRCVSAGCVPREPGQYNMLAECPVSHVFRSAGGRNTCECPTGKELARDAGGQWRCVPRCTPGIDNPACAIGSDSCGVGNPILPAIAVKTQTEVDYQGAGAHALEFRRSFRSSGTRPYVAPGAWSHWVHNWGRRIETYPEAGYSSSRAYVIRDDASQLIYTTDGSGAWQAWQVGDRNRLIETRDAAGARTGFQYQIWADDSIEHYDPAGSLLRVVQRNGWTNTLTYSTTATPAAVAPRPGLLIGVRNHFGRELRFTYDSAGRLAELLPPGGVSGTTPGTAASPIRYGHNEATGLGAGVAAANQLTSVTWQDGATRRYHHEQGSQPALLTGITDELGVRIATYAYTASGRAWRTQGPGGSNTVEISYGAFGDRTDVIDRSGATPVTTTYRWQLVQGLVRPVSVSAPCPLCGSAAASTSYTASGEVARSVGHDGRITFFSYDSQGRETERALFPAAYNTATTRPALSAAESVTTTQWHATWNLATQVAAPGQLSAWTYNAEGMPTATSWTATTDPTGAAAFNATRTGSTHAMTWVYDASGLVSSIVTTQTPAGGAAVETGTWSYTYDAQANRTREWNRSSGRIHDTFEFTADGRVLEGVDEHNVRYRYSRDSRGQVREHHYGVPSAPRAAVTGGLANLAGGYMTAHTYDGAGRLTSTTRSNAAPVSVAYSPQGVVTGITVGSSESLSVATTAARTALPEIGGSGLFLCNRGTTVLPIQLGNHAYLWDLASQRCCGRNEGQDPLLSCAEPGPPSHSCTFVEGSVGKEREIISCCQTTANDGPWRPWRNDCHNSAERCVTAAGLKYTAAPGARAGQCPSCWLTPGTNLPPLPTVP